MESLPPNKECWYYVKLLTFILGIGMEVLHNYFEQKILLAMEFYVFLDSYKHCLFHECYPAVRCCKCSKDCVVSNSNTGYLTKSQFRLLYDSVPPTEMDHYKTEKNNKIIQECLCRIDAKRSNEVDCMDITLMLAIIESCFLKKNKTIHGDPSHLKTIRNTRNFWHM
ncbi:CEP90 [Mytilus edulis]|uniref:PIBF1 n=1 Tax=Mytilus edulis TaxID=6550 RepID=A0A8S3T7J4_MYTED|nr:CEP90 [Mytilus edulis]